MAATLPGYVHRYTRILRALEVLSYYPDGLPLAQLAAELGATPADLREEILAYYTAEPAAGAGYRLPGVGWVSPTGEEVDPEVAEIVVLTDPQALADLGAVRLTTEQMAGVWRAGRILAEYEPDNQVLEQALDVLAEGWLGGPLAESDPGAGLVAQIRDAIKHRHQLRFTYAREFRPGIATRTVHPYRLICTHRGWELDAGPLDAEGLPRTFLLGNVSDLEVLDEGFEVPAGVDAILAANRAQVRVELSLPQRSAWGVDTQADRVDVLRSDADTVAVRAELSPPYARRLALILAPTMGQGMLIDHREFAGQIREVAQRLLAHHGFPIP
jgi:proteasome accessory factor C